MTATQSRPDPPTPNADTTRPSDRPGRRRGVPRSRLGGVWVTLIVAAVVFVFLLIFVVQNDQRAQVSFLGAHGHLPMGVALLFAAVFGMLLVALPGTARIIQLRMLSRRRGLVVTAPPAPPAAPDTPATE